MAHTVTNNCPGFLKDGTCHDPNGEHKTGPPDIVISPKSSRWSDAEREADTATPPSVPPTVDARPPLPPWVGDFGPGSTFIANGWEIGVCHVGCEGGMWAMLVMPIKPTRGLKRSEYRRLRAQVGKKEAKRLLAAHTEETTDEQEDVE